MRYTGSLDVRCVRTCVCNPAAVTAAEELHARKIRTCVCNQAALKVAEELHARSKGYSTSVVMSRSTSSEHTFLGKAIIVCRAGFRRDSAAQRRLLESAAK